MTKDEIISQGYLAAYLTEDLTADEKVEVEQFIASDQEVRSEYLELQRTLEILSFQHGLHAGESVKRTVMENPSVMGRANLGAAPGASSGTNTWKFLTAASIIIMLLSVLSAIYFWNQWQSTDSRLAKLTLQNMELAESYHIVNEELSDIREDLAILVSPEFSRIILEGTENAPASKAVIYWNREYEEVYLNSASLADLPETSQYQLWALIDGKPIDAGVFDASDGTFQIMKNIAKADAFAVTIEDAGGSESPSLETMQVYGET